MIPHIYIAINKSESAYYQLDYNNEQIVYHRYWPNKESKVEKHTKEKIDEFYNLAMSKGWVVRDPEDPSGRYPRQKQYIGKGYARNSAKRSKTKRGKTK